MPADIEPVEPFPIEIRTAFNKMIDDILYTNRERIERYQINRIAMFLLNPAQKSHSSADANLRQRALHSYQLINGEVFRKLDLQYTQPRMVLDKS